MATYHFRRPERMIAERQELLEIIQGQKYMCLALCKDNVPYLVTVNYGYDAGENCFYFHCAAKGKKIDCLRDNPLVWGQVLEDRGYLDGECNHAYRTVQFLGRAEFLDDKEAKRRALHLMIDHLESAPEAAKKKHITESALENGECTSLVAIVRVRVEEMTGKMNPVKKG